jgi:hypothetical protein
MKAILLMFLLACGGKAPAPAPVENTAPGSAEPSSDGTIRVVQRGSTGGVIELAGSRDAAMASADKEMASVCGANQYTITQEGEEAVKGTDGNITGTAWRVHYQCNR